MAKYRVLLCFVNKGVPAVKKQAAFSKVKYKEAQNDDV